MTATSPGYHPRDVVADGHRPMGRRPRRSRRRWPPGAVDAQGEKLRPRGHRRAPRRRQVIHGPTRFLLSRRPSRSASACPHAPRRRAHVHRAHDSTLYLFNLSVPLAVSPSNRLVPSGAAPGGCSPVRTRSPRRGRGHPAPPRTGPPRARRPPRAAAAAAAAAAAGRGACPGRRRSERLKGGPRCRTGAVELEARERRSHQQREGARSEWGRGGHSAGWRGAHHSKPAPDLPPSVLKRKYLH